MMSHLAFKDRNLTKTVCDQHTVMSHPTAPTYPTEHNYFPDTNPSADEISYQLLDW
jgi:hypothetical protein